MFTFLSNILDSSMYSPHGICLLWEPQLVWLHVVSDALTSVAYLSIPAVILFVWLKRPDFKYRWMAWLFVAFIVSCGATHALAIYTLWVPIYGIEGLVKASTAIASVLTALAMWKALPDLLIMPTLAQMQKAQQDLKSQTRKTADAEQLVQRFRDVEASAEQIKQAQKMEAFGQLTGGIAHDFNNLLTIITGSVDELSTAVKSRPHLVGLVQMIDQAASRGAALTAQLLAFARKQPLSPSSVDVDTLVVRLVRMLRQTLGRNIEIDVALTNDLPAALVDEGQLDTALLNLALNARDAMPTGGRLLIETSIVELVAPPNDRHPELMPGWYVVISMLDSGCGIEPEKIGKVFEPFFTTKDVDKGTGLGLSMVYGFVKQSRGHIVIASDLGTGTKIDLFLPAVAAPVGVTRPSEAPSTMLVVEDDPLVQASITGLIGRLGFKALTSSSPSDVLRQLGQPNRIDALLIGAVHGAIGRCQLASEAAKVRPELTVVLLGASEDERTNLAELAVVVVESSSSSAKLSLTIVEALTGSAAHPRTSLAPVDDD